jgi:hypothetical protein
MARWLALLSSNLHSGSHAAVGAAAVVGGGIGVSPVGRCFVGVVGKDVGMHFGAADDDMDYEKETVAF